MTDAERVLLEQMQGLIEKWRMEGARCDTFHATMGTGYKACADDLAALLRAFPQTPEPTEPNEALAFLKLILFGKS